MVAARMVIPVVVPHKTISKFIVQVHTATRKCGLITSTLSPPAARPYVPQIVRLANQKHNTKYWSKTEVSRRASDIASMAMIIFKVLIMRVGQSGWQPMLKE